MRVKVLILGGGESPEREVSLRSAKAVANAAKEAGFAVEERDPKDGIGFLNSLKNDIIIFPILHGQGGEDGSLQAEFEKRHLAFLGAGSQASENCFDKWKSHKILEESGVPMPNGALVTSEGYRGHTLATKPHVLKVNHGGSSIGTLIVRDPAKITPDQIHEIFKMEESAVLEELIEGIEVTVPILDQSALPAIEIRLPTNAEFNYENKYNGQTQEICPPASLTQDQHQDAQYLAEKVHKIMNCQHLSRVDMIMGPDGSFKVLEINTIPGLTDQSLYPKSAAAVGINMPALVKKFVDLVTRDYKLD